MPERIKPQTASAAEGEDRISPLSDVVRDLRRSSSQPLEYMGSAVGSHFQSEPLLYGPDGRRLPPLSDWEIEVHKHLEAQPSAIEGLELEHTFPRFLPNKERYIDRSAALGENMLRISMDFARLCPSPDQFDENMMVEYVKALALIRARGIEPMVTLHHFTMPRYLLDIDAQDTITAGGWEHPEVNKHFRFYVERVMRYLANDDKVRASLREIGLDRVSQDKFLAEGLVKYFMSINEPAVTMFNSYMTGVFPPFRRGNILVAKRVMERMIEAHDVVLSEAKASTAHRASDRVAQVGIGYNWQFYDGVFGRLVEEFDHTYTKRFERNGVYSDFLGLQYYFRMTVPLLMGKSTRAYGDHPAFGDVYPPGIFETLKKMHAAYPEKEIFVTEFGFSDATDQRRPYWLLETVHYILEAKRAGLPIKGMLLWSLVNNFEWNLGMSQKFGLFEERDLQNPFTHSSEQIGSWEVWQAALTAMATGSDEAYTALDVVYKRAKEQYQQVSQRRR